MRALSGFAAFMDHAIDRHPVWSRLTYIISAAFMAAFVVYTW